MRLKEQIGPEETNQPSRITDSGETTNKEEKRFNNKRGKLKKEAVKAATKANPDADRANEAAKPLTRSKRQNDRFSNVARKSNATTRRRR